MKDLLICSGDPMFIKNLYGALRQEGHGVDTVERTAMAVQMSLRKRYWVVILDAHAIGLPVNDAAEIIQRSGATVLIVGESIAPTGVITDAKPLDVGNVRDYVRDLCKSAAETQVQMEGHES